MPITSAPASGTGESYLVWPFVDVHAHIGDTVNRTPPVGQSFERYLARMAQTNVVAALPSTAGGGPRERGLPDVRGQNDATAAGCRGYPDRFPSVWRTSRGSRDADNRWARRMAETHVHSRP